MPHAWIEVSANIADEPEIRQLKELVYEAALETGIFPLGGVRVRFQVIDDYLVGDRHPDNAFVHIVLRIGAGRDLVTRKRAADAVFERVCTLLKPLNARAPLAVAFEVQEMSEDLNYKFNNLHEHIKKRSAA
ncbi:5-carboxymethyl-2-hydroxymuconate isomerase [Chelatococcus sp. YT9]|uniref:5-carboxymethyl-2-hydroxymuconate isomerase n=1 Tax=Chelatococcus sp. YT9 TaxID=2835635 RepID=UPI001BCF1EF7|nr:5-carboxymethyl-2-hydroxymuconate isomerase [Chelatococcus sp. YT9]